MQNVNDYMTVRAYAAHKRVTPQAVYIAIKEGRVVVRDWCGLKVVPLAENTYRP